MKGNRMSFIPPLDLDDYPPFEGFPRRGLTFFRELKRNNNRTWFERHKGEYETYVKAPMESLIASLRASFARFAPEFDVNPKRAVFRIYRDIRFSKDKTPYKTHVAAHIVLRGKPKGLVGSGYYLDIEPGEVFVGAGIYMPDGDQLKRIRKALDSRGHEFLEIVRNRRFTKLFGAPKGETLKRIPAGYDEYHPMAEWLKFKQFFVGVSWKDSVCTRPTFADEAARACEVATPFVQYLNRALGF